jgi:hypothetical protein
LVYWFVRIFIDFQYHRVVLGVPTLYNDQPNLPHLVWQESVLDVLRGKFHTSSQSFIGVLQLVVLLAQGTQWIPSINGLIPGKSNNVERDRLFWPFKPGGLLKSCLETS